MHYSYSGMSCQHDESVRAVEVRDSAAAMLRKMRRRGFPVFTLERGQRWEIGEPEGCQAVPDACGTLAIEHETHSCDECGQEYETHEEASQCCAFLESDTEED